MTEQQRIEQLEKDLVTFSSTLVQLKQDMLAYFAIGDANAKYKEVK